MKKIAILLLNLCVLNLFSNPSKEQIMHGDVNITSKNNILNIDQFTNKAIINWEHFSISENEITYFNMPSSTASILNRVVTNNPSNIYGQLLSNGSIYLINPNGIFIGPNAIINTHNFFASTLHLTNEDFLNSKDMNLENNNFSKIENLGRIQASKNIHIISERVENKGSINAQNTHLIGANKVFLLDLESNAIIKTDSIGSIDNTGLIDSINTQIEAFGGNAYSLAINQDGVITNTKYETNNSKVVIIADNIAINEHACIDISSINNNEILIGGDYKGKNPNIRNAKTVFIDSKAIIKADGLKNANGGKIIIWSDENTSFYGNVSAKGGNLSGDGGFIEVSSKSLLNYQGRADLTSSNGKTGALLLDPSNITINASGTTNMNESEGGADTYSPAGDNSILKVLGLETALSTANVIVTTTGAGTQEGDITISDNISWSNATTLTLEAERSIVVSRGVTIQNTHSGSGNFLAMDFKANKQVTPTLGNFSGIQLNNVTLSSNEGNISLQGKGGGFNQFNTGILISQNSLIESTGLGADAATIFLDGISNIGGFMNIGIKINSSIITTSDGNITLNALSSSNSSMNYGILLEQSSSINSLNDANITITSEISSAISNTSAICLIDNSVISTNNGDILITANNDFATNQFNNAFNMLNQCKIQSIGSGDITINSTTSGTSFNDAIVLDTSYIENNQGFIQIIATSNGTDDYNNGITLKDFSKVSSSTVNITAGDITINGTSGTGSNENYGFNINFSTISSVSKNINITSLSRGTDLNNYGSSISMFSLIESTGIDANAADITINGTGGNSNYGLYKDGTSSISSAMGDITIIGTKNW